MYCSRNKSLLFNRQSLQSILKNRHHFVPYSTTTFHSPQITSEDVIVARSYCSNLLKKFDSPSYTLQTFIPRSVKDAYLSIRAFNIELARIPDLVSNRAIGSLRMQFWRDNITQTFSNAPPREPVAILLHHALNTLRERHPDSSTNMMKAWFLKVIDARELYMDNRSYPSLDALEVYSENTYSTLLYLSLAALPMHSVAIDHIASHIGKAIGITAVLRGLPLIAFPPPPNHHSKSFSSSATAGEGANRRQGTIVLPLDVMAEAGVKEEDIFRQASQAPRLKDAVFIVATRANDHLITAREMIKNLQKGHGIEHGHNHGDDINCGNDEPHKNASLYVSDIERSFGFLMHAVPTRLWLEKLERLDFDIFREEMRARDWLLPWKSYLAYSRRSF
ncbi:phytoene synthase-like precursor [Blumeria hordei DH14]|uniref:Phytoene synthase-like n=1 Tax=Blumeria graminis f. sp. hordei (strain DH14) TaxID=546991 RepID=N1J5H4_BLUG1|nr:phytoene synthase-like precursor [Blumeria hordei DH14]